MNNCIKPGQIWLDMEGKRIHAHGGDIFFENDTFYWYGENKEKTDGKSDIWTWGIRCYSSKDLYNWKDEGLIIEPSQDENSMLYPTRHIDRPHIIKNPVTGKYVCWLKISGKDACFVILTADFLIGPYIIEKEGFRPLDKKAGDYALAQDMQTGKGYLYFDSDHNSVTCVELTDDYLNVTEERSLHYEDLYPPFCREGITHFMRNGKHYLLSSGMTNYIPNPSESAISDDWHGPYDVQGNLHINDDSSASFNSQISAVFKHPLKDDLYIALADRWVPEFVVDKKRYELISKVIASRFDEKYQADMSERKMMMETPIMGNVNTSIADYVWLPIRFEGDRALIDWKEEWHIEDYK